MEVVTIYEHVKYCPDVWNYELKFHYWLIIEDLLHNLAHVGQVASEELVDERQVYPPWPNAEKIFKVQMCPHRENSRGQAWQLGSCVLGV